MGDGVSFVSRLAAIGCVVAHVTGAHAETIDAATKATARQLGEEGMRALDAGDCATASEKLWRAHDLVHVPTLAFYAGQCLEKLGRLVDAEEKYLEAMRDPIEPGAPGPVRAAQADAEKARDALLPRIPSVLITLRPPFPDAVLLIDGKPVPPAMIGVKRPIDPGNHVAQVQRAGGAGSRPFSLAEGQALTLEVDVPAPAAGYSYPYTYAYPPRGAMGMYPPLPPPPPTKRRSTGLFVAGAILAPLGGVGALTGVLEVAVTNSSEPGGALIGAGLGVMVAGITMAVIGGKRVPVVDAPPPAVSFEPLTSGMRVCF